MKKLIIHFRYIMQTGSLFLILLGLPFADLHAQDSPNDIIPDGSTLQKLSTDQFQFTEGPVWYNDSVLLFTDADITPPKIYRYDPVGINYSVFRSNSDGANGLTLDKSGNLLACETKGIVMMNKTGAEIKVLASHYNGKSFNGPNDLIADSKGGVYFSDPVYFTQPVQDKEAVYYIDPAGNVTRVIDDLAKPNGLILSPDGTKLYVVDSDDKFAYSWEVAADGSLSGKSVLAELQTNGGTASGADGMAIDNKGNVFVASDKGVQVFSAQGDALTTIVVPDKPSNCDFGGHDFKTLYITGKKNLYSIELTNPGYAVSRKTFPDAVNSLPGAQLVEIYPNPVRDVLYVHHNFSRINSIDIFSMDGEREPIVIKSDQFSGLEITTAELKTGIYLLRIASNEGVITRKFIKE